MRLHHHTSVALILLALAAPMPLPLAGSIATSSLYAQGEVPRARVQRGTLIRTVDSIGQLKAARSAQVTAPFEGKLVRLLPEGTRVTEGETIGWMDTQALEERKREQDSALELAKKDLEAAHEEYRLQELENEYTRKSEQANVELAEQKQRDTEQKLETERVLVERGISPRSNLDEAQLAALRAAVETRNARINLQKNEENLLSDLRLKQNKIDKAQLAVQTAQRNLDETLSRIANAEIKAPANGEISYLRVWRSGQMSKVAEGDNVWPRSAMLEIPDRSEMLAVVPVNELDISLVEPGQPVVVRLDAVPGQDFRGVVERKSIVPIESQFNMGSASGGGTTGPREFEVRIRMNEQNDAFFQGMTASVQIEVARVEDALLVPVDALTVEKEDLGVFRAGSGTAGAQFVGVKVKETNDLYAAVDAPLDAGQEIFLRHPGVSLERALDLARTASNRVALSLRENAPARPVPTGDQRPGGAPAAGPMQGGQQGQGERRRPGGMQGGAPGGWGGQGSGGGAPAQGSGQRPQGAPAPSGGS